MKEQLFNTFVTNTGSVDQQIKRATGIQSQKTFLEQMQQKPNRQVRDLLVTTPCNQSCPGCFFNEYGRPDTVPLTPETLTELRGMIKALRQPDPEYFAIYPKEITTAMPILPIMSELGIDRTLTNGKILNKEGVIDALKQANIKKLAITVPGGKEAYSIYTNNNPDEYSTLLSNVKLAVDSGFDVSVFMPMFKQNLNDIKETVVTLGNMKVNRIQFLRVRKFGNAENLPDEYFMTKEDMPKFLEDVNKTREFVGKKLPLTLFGGSFGPNFFGTSIYRQLAGINPKFPNSKYFCPVVDRQFVGVSFATKKAYSCFMGMSFNDAEVGYYQDGSIVYTKPAISSGALRTNLRGICSNSNCEYQMFCLGGCLMNAFTLAKQRQEIDPFFGGQDICLTIILKELMGGDKK